MSGFQAPKAGLAPPSKQTAFPSTDYDVPIHGLPIMHLTNDEGYQSTNSWQPLQPKPASHIATESGSSVGSSTKLGSPGEHVWPQEAVLNPYVLGRIRKHAKDVAEEVHKRYGGPVPLLPVSPELSPIIPGFIAAENRRILAERLPLPIQRQGYGGGSSVGSVHTASRPNGGPLGISQASPNTSALSSRFYDNRAQYGQYVATPHAPRVWLDTRSIQSYPVPSPIVPSQRLHYPSKGTFRKDQPLLRHLPPVVTTPQFTLRNDFPSLQYQRNSNDPEALAHRVAELRKLALHYIRETNKENVHPMNIFRDPDDTSVESDSDTPRSAKPQQKSKKGKEKTVNNRIPDLPPNASRWLHSVTDVSMIDNFDNLNLMSVIAYTDLLSTLMKVYPKSVDKSGLRDDIEMLEWARNKKVKAWLDSTSDDNKMSIKKKREERSSEEDAIPNHSAKRKRAGSKDAMGAASTEQPPHKKSEASKDRTDPLVAEAGRSSKAPPKSMLKHIRMKKEEATAREAALSPEKLLCSEPAVAKTFARTIVKAKAIPKPWMSRQVVASAQRNGDEKSVGAQSLTAETQT